MPLSCTAAADSGQRCTTVPRADSVESFAEVKTAANLDSNLGGGWVIRGW